MLRLKLQSFCRLMLIVDSFEKILMLGLIRDRRRRARQRMRCLDGWHHRLDGHEFGWTPGVGDGQGGLVCCDSWASKESDTTEILNWTELMHVLGKALYENSALASQFFCATKTAWKIVIEHLITFLLAILHTLYSSFLRLWITVEYFFALVFPIGPTSKESACQCRRPNETRVQYLGREDPLEEEMTTHSSILAWRIPWTEGPGGLPSTGLQRVGHNWRSLACMYILLYHMRTIFLKK